MRISDWSSDLCSSDLTQILPFSTGVILEPLPVDRLVAALPSAIDSLDSANWFAAAHSIMTTDTQPKIVSRRVARSEEHTSELQSLMRISYAVFCLKQKKLHIQTRQYHNYVTLVYIHNT